MSRGAPVKVLPTWMWDDPAIVAERMENGERKRGPLRDPAGSSQPTTDSDRIRRAFPNGVKERGRGDEPAAVALPEFAPSRPSYGLVTAGTLRLIKRARIRELVAMVVKGRAR